MIPLLEKLGLVVNSAGLSERQLVEELRRTKPTGIITFSEFRIADTVRLAAELGLRYHAPADLDAITHKDRQRERFEAVGLDTVGFRTVTSTDEIDTAIAHVGLPAIVKPVIGASSRNTVAVTDADECRAVIRAALTGAPGRPAEQAVMLEELLVGRSTDAPWGDYIAVDCVADGDDVRPVFVTSKFALAEPFRERGGYGGLSVVPDDEVRQVRELACRAVGALGIHGVADVEIKLTADGPRVIEVNGRLGAWVDDLAVRSGATDPADTAVRAALGLEYHTTELITEGPVAFHYLLVPPMGAERVKKIRDVGALRAVPRVDRVAVLVEEGASVDWRLGAGANVAALVGVTRDHGELAETVAAIEDVDWIDYE
ncbi:ATP-grasp domain-containing protein [Streptomyces sp. NPDC041068]|uniref:ATP-grasp domain-containing protein n=1 Tax=Streptomyces sp. NPDC041068 TaxID=3155130 RepID=UPI0034069505